MRAFEVAAGDERPGLRQKLTRARVAVRDERVQLRETLRQRGRVSRLALEDEQLQARGQVRGRACDDLGEARAASGLVGRRRRRVRLHASREAPARLEVARVERRRFLEGGARGGGPVSLVLEESANRLQVRPIPQRERLAEESLRARKILLAQRRDCAVRERQRFTRQRVDQLRERRARFLRPILLELREAHVAQRQDARRLLGGEPGEEGFSAEERDDMTMAAARIARAAHARRSKRNRFLERGLKQEMVRLIGGDYCRSEAIARFQISSIGGGIRRHRAMNLGRAKAVKDLRPLRGARSAPLTPVGRAIHFYYRWLHMQPPHMRQISSFSILSQANLSSVPFPGPISRANQPERL